MTDDEITEMPPNRYQELSRETVRYSANIHNVDPEILFLGNSIAGEAGEVNEKIKKWAREDNEDYFEDLDKEIGDIIWYLARLMDKLDLTFEGVLTQNLEKTHYRFENGKIMGEGDQR